ncbi:hypothetical protein [Spirosoma panaciterrae]|uniref:hypothetical protein n=1 Tax=Spirosoma panaciterrae TaxID=496058 RepID=UPI00038219D8|nr:hypothetical protein [Spirosoma panaciterrae]
MIGNGYELTKAFYAEVEQNESMQMGCKPHHQSLYTWICELRNRMKREILDLPVLHTMQMSFIGSQHTLAKAIDDLAAWGIIEVIMRTKGHGTKVKLAIAYLQKHCNSDAIEEGFAIADMQFQCNTTAIQVQTTKTNKRNKTGIKKDKRVRDEPTVLEPEKVMYRENVLLKVEERDTLVAKYGDAFVERCFDKLSSYKLSSGKQYKSDYGAINSWVIDEVEKTQHRKSTRTSSTNPVTNQPQPAYANRPLPSRELT